MNQSKHTNLGLGILIGGLAAALFLRHSPDEKDNLPELESTKVFEQDFSLDFEESPILATEIDEFEALHSVDFDEQISRNSGATLQGIKVVSTPERDLPLPEMFPAGAKQNRNAAIAKVEPAKNASEQRIEQHDEKTERESIPAQTVNAKVSGATADFPLPKNMFTESFLREPSETDKTPRDSKPTGETAPHNKVTTQNSEAKSSSNQESIRQPNKPAGNVIIPRRVRLGEPVARQVGVLSRESRKFEVNSTSRERLDPDASTKSDHDGFLSLDGLDPLPNPAQRD